MEMFFATEYLVKAMGSTPASYALYREPNKATTKKENTAKTKAKKKEEASIAYSPEEKIMLGFPSQI